MIDNLKNIVFFSDLHFGGRNDEDAHAARLADAIVGTLNPETDLVVLCGDLVDDPTPEAIEACARWIERLETAGIAVLATVGNHDCARWGVLGVDEGLRAQVVLSLVTARPGVQGDLIEPPWWYDTDAMRIILLDSQWGLRGWGRRPDLARGRIGEAQLRELARLIDEGRDLELGVVVVLHHRPGYTTAHVEDDNALEDADALADVLTAHPVDVVVCGHQHPPPGTRLAELDDVAGEALVCPKATSPHEGRLWGWWYEVASRRATAVGW